MNIPPDKFRCAKCGDVFDKGLSEEEALAERKEVWGDAPDEEVDLVCDDCWEKDFPQTYRDGTPIPAVVRRQEMCAKHGWTKIALTTVPS